MHPDDQRSWSHRTKRSLLLVEDDESLRQILVLILDEAFDVMSASTIEVALRLIREISSIDVVLTDFHLGDPLGRTGITVAETFRQTNPHGTVILMSGSNLEASQKDFIKNELAAEFVTKPLVLTGKRRLLQCNKRDESFLSIKNHF